NPNLEPYSSWRDFGLSLKNGENFGRGTSTSSLVNFVAAYGTHPSIVDATTIDAKRAAADLLVNGTATTEMVERLSGPDRYGAAAAISRAHFQVADTVFIASGQLFTDALSGGPAAKAAGAPTLLVRQNAIPSATALEIAR